MVRLLAGSLIAFLLAQDDAQIQAWIENLDDSHIEVREKAMQDLVRVGERAEPFLKAARNSESPEVRMRAGEALEAIALSRKMKEAYRDPEPLRIEFENADLADVLTELGRQAGYRIDVEDVELQGTVSLKLKAGTFMQALDLLCAARPNLTWAWTETGARLKSGRHIPYPSSYSGAFKVLVPLVHVSRKTDFKDIAFEVHLGVATSCEFPLKPMTPVLLEPGRALDDAGNELRLLRWGDPTARGHGYPPSDFIARLARTGESEGDAPPDFKPRGVFFVSGVTAGTKSIRSVTGTATFFFPLESVELAFDAPSRGDMREAGDFVFRIDRIQGSSIQVIVAKKTTGDPSLHELDYDSLVAVDAKGREHRPTSAKAAAAGNPAQALLQGGAESRNPSFRAVFPGVQVSDLKTFKFRFITRGFEKNVPFEFRDIQLP
ncbi:MAG: hypothetical protein HY716_08845 [Planctomycetes bacterium]|nr:hypothetical protein [Planctomycetota bacterium]